MNGYERFKHATICWTRKWLWEIAAGQILLGFGLWLLAKPWQRGGEPPVILAMSALALVLSGVTTFAVVAVAEKKA